MNEPVEEDDLEFRDYDIVGYYEMWFPTGEEVMTDFIMSIAQKLNTSEDNVAKELVRATGITIPRFIELVDEYKWDVETIWTLWVKSCNPKLKAVMNEIFGRSGFRVHKQTFLNIMELNKSTPPLFDSNTLASLWGQKPQQEQKQQPSSKKNWFQKLFGL